VLLPRLDSNFIGDTLQTAKLLLFFRLPWMLLYCIMRECDNIHS
jgi:hypothetical protein